MELMKDMDTMLPDKYTGFEDPRLKVSDNGGFILEYTGVYKPKGAKPLDNVQRDWGVRWYSPQIKLRMPYPCC